MDILKSLLLVITLAVAGRAFGQVKVSQEGYNIILEKVKSIPKVTAVNLYAEYVKNGVTWEENYKDSLRIITGVISNIGRDVLGMERVVSLKTRTEVIKGLPGYRTIDVVYPEKMPENVKKTLSSYKIGQNVELLVRIRKTPNTIDIVYYDDALPSGYAIQIYKLETIYVCVPETDIGKKIKFKDEDGGTVLDATVPSISFSFDYGDIPYDAYSIEVGDYKALMSELKE